MIWNRPRSRTKNTLDHLFKQPKMSNPLAQVLHNNRLVVQCQTLFRGKTYSGWRFFEDFCKRVRLEDLFQR